MPAWAVVPVLGLAVAGAAAGAASVTFEPTYSAVQVGQTLDLRLRVDAPGDSLSGFRLYLSFDPEVVELTEALEGSLYHYTGHETWFVTDELEPGLWLIFDTVMGVGTYVLPPGEILDLEFEALAPGNTRAHIDTFLLADVRREDLSVSEATHGDIHVFPATGIDGEETLLRLGPASPNPFATGTAIAFELPGGLPSATAGVYDSAGRLVRELEVPEGATAGRLSWDGKLADGREAPSSVYFVKLSSGGADVRARIVKLR